MDNITGIFRGNSVSSEGSPSEEQGFANQVRLLTADRLVHRQQMINGDVSCFVPWFSYLMPQHCLGEQGSKDLSYVSYLDSYYQSLDRPWLPCQKDCWSLHYFIRSVIYYPWQVPCFWWVHGHNWRKCLMRQESWQQLEYSYSWS